MTQAASPAPDSGPAMPPLTLLVNQLTQAMSGLLNVARSTTDITTLLQLNAEYGALQTVVNQATQAQMAKDDHTFEQAVNGLKVQATLLTNMESQISKIVADVAMAGKVAGYVAQAISIIAKL